MDLKEKAKGLVKAINETEVQLKNLKDWLKQTKIMMYLEDPSPVHHIDQIPSFGSEVIVWNEEGKAYVVEVNEYWTEYAFDRGWIKWAYIPE